jgi:chromosome segregation ATPase
MAEEALQTARASASSVPPVQFAAMMTTVERLQGEQTRLASAVEAVRETGDGVDEECEKRLQQATQDMEQVRAGVEALQATWQREALEIRVEARSIADEARRCAQADMARLADELQTEVEAQRQEQTRDGVRVRSAEEQVGRAHADVMAAAEKTARELAVLQRDRAEQQAQRQQDAQRLVSAEETARRARAEMLAVAEQMSEELATLRRALAEQRDGGLQIGARLEGAEEVGQQARAEMAATAAQITEEIAAFERTLVAHRAERTEDGKRLERAEEAARSARVEVATVTDRAERELAELRRMLAMQQEARREDDLRLQASEAMVLRVQCEAIAAAEAAVRSTHAETTAAAERTAGELAELRHAVAEQHGAQRQELEWLQGRLGRARRAVVKVVRRVRAAARVADVRAVARAQDYGEQVTTVREQTTAALAALRQEHAELTREVTVRLADVPSASEQRTVRAFLDGCETQLTEFAARLDVQGAARAASDEQSRQRLEAEVDGLKTVTDRLDGEHRRLAADVEERLRGLMRTAAGGFDVQLALLRGKVEVLARTMRERVPGDPETPHADGLLEHRRGLLERLRQQLAALQTGTGWHPQHVLDLLIESTLAAAVTPVRRLLQLTEWDTSEEQKAPADGADATLTDESTSPS